MYDFFVLVSPSVITQSLIRDFSISATGVGLLGASFYYTYALMQVPAGWLIDKYGARKILTLFSFVAGLASILFALSPHFSLSLFARALLGGAVSCGFIASYFLASRWLPHQYFSLFAAGLHLLGTVGAMLAQGPLAILVNHLGWRVAIAITGLAGILLAGCYGFAIRDGESRLEKPIQSSSSFRAALRKCLSSSQVCWIALCGFLGWLPLSIIGALWGVPYLMKVYHWSTIEAASVCRFFWFGSGFGGLLLSIISEKLRSRRGPLLFCFMGEIVGALVLIEAPVMPVFFVYAALFLLGVCVCMQTLSFSIIKENVASPYFTCASGMNNFGAMISSALGQSLFGVLLDWQAGPSHVYSVFHYQCALMILPLAGVCGVYIILTKIKETHCQPYQISTV